MRRRLIAASIAIACGCGVLWYLRDPPWLITQTSGLRAWEPGADGRPFRWSGSHASFFVPSDVRAVQVPVATTFDGRGSEPMMVTFSIDGARAARVTLTAADWRQVTLTMPARGSRRVRRIDVRTSVAREDNHGVRLGLVKVSRDGTAWLPCC